NYIATNLDSSVREIEGVLIQINATATLVGKNITSGVIPKLSDNKNFEFITIRFRSHTEKSLSPNQTFLQTIRQHSDFNFTDKSETIIGKYAQGQENNYWSIFKKNQLSGNKHKTYILVFDQFEELFTYPQALIDEFKQGFAEIILENQYPAFFDDFEDAVFDNKEKIPKEEIDLLYSNINIKTVFAMRSDRLSELNNFADKITDIQKVFYELQPLDKEQAEQAIVNPANQEGNFDSKPFTYEKAALKKIINALTKKDKIETTQLQIVCQRLEDNIIAAKKTDAIISEKDIPAFEDIFRDFYHDATSKVNIEERDKVRKFIEDQLIIDSRRISLDILVCQKHVNLKTLKKLVDTRLLRAEPNTTGGFSYELSHDTLVPPITEIAKKRRDEEEKERLREKQRRQIRIITLAIVVSVVSIGVAVFGLMMWQKAEKQTKIANNMLLDKAVSIRLSNSEPYKNKNRNVVLQSIRKLDLSNLNLKELPNDIILCENLTELNLAGNDALNLDIAFSLLAKLPIKKLSLNYIKINWLPSEILLSQNLSALIIDLDESADMYQIIETLSQLTNLDTLYIGNCSYLPNNISKLNQIKFISISGNRSYKFDLIPEFFKLDMLREAYFFDLIIDSIPDEISQLSNLEAFSMSNSDGNLPSFDIKYIPKSLSSLHKLRKVNFYGNKGFPFSELCETFSDYPRDIIITNNENTNDRLNNRLMIILSLDVINDDILKVINLKEMIIADDSLMSLPSYMYKLHNLEHMTLFLPKLNLTHEISNLKNLKSLVIIGTNFSNEKKSKLESWFKDTNCEIVW
ncbi:MAG: hypothetical protein U9Q83_03400, partial [Bacteroidota bacterium]|nr:hypothetical protein [Bacteroidota bacterium]